MMKPKKAHGLDIFRTLGAIDQHDMTFYDGLTVEERKAFVPIVVMQWASAAPGRGQDWYLDAINERVNPYMFDLHQYPDLLYRLMASCGVGAQRHQWIAAGTNSQKTKRDFVEKYYPHANDLEASIILQHLSDPINLDVFLTGSGIQNDEIKRIKKLFA